MNRGPGYPVALLKAVWIGEYEWPHSLSASTSDKREIVFGVSSVLNWVVINMDFSK